MSEREAPQIGKSPPADGRIRFSRDAIPTFLYLIAAIAFVSGPFALLDFPLDDAWIHRVYAESFALGNGLAYNGTQPEAGATSPLFAIVTAPFHWFTFAGVETVVLLVKLFGVFLGMHCVLCTQRIAFALLHSRTGAIIAASFIALDPGIHFSTLSGMETLLLVTLLLLTCDLGLRGRHLSALLCISLTPTVRPEALLLLPLAVYFLIRLFRTMPSLLHRIGTCAVVLLPVAAWMVFCLHATGHPFPNTYYIKAHPFSAGLQQLQIAADGLTLYSLIPRILILPGLGLLCLCCWKNRNGLLPFLFLIAAPVVYALGVSGSRVVFLESYFWSRWFDPAAHLMTVGLCVALGDLARRLPGWVAADNTAPAVLTSVRRLLARTPVIAALLFLLVAPALVPTFLERRSRMASDARSISHINVDMGKWIAQHTQPSDTVSVNDAGAIRYFGKRNTTDLIGLNNADIAFGRMSATEAIRKSDWLVIFPGFFTGPLMTEVQTGFIPRAEVRLSPEDYTVVRSPNPIVKVAFEKKRSPDNP